jgi:hypothetical protein
MSLDRCTQAILQEVDTFMGIVQAAVGVGMHVGSLGLLPVTSIAMIMSGRHRRGTVMEGEKEHLYGSVRGRDLQGRAAQGVKGK